MCGENRDLVAAVEEALQQVVEEEPELAAAVRPIIFTNLAECRLQRFLNSGTVSTPGEYIHRVVIFYKEWRHYLRQVQVEKDPEVWDDLLAKLQRWAYAFLGRRGIPPGPERVQMAVDCAADAGSRLVRLRFPFDSHFDAWACLVVQRLCLQHLGGLKNHNALPYRDLEALDEWLKAWSKTTVLDQTRLVELSLDLLQAIEQLGSEARKQFILLYYGEQKTFDEIATLMGKSKNALYKLHSDALKELGKILTKKGDKYE
ncbi:MAG: RNA polymerase sigma factor [Chloroflexi bacterium]|nr:RNA polymerase sigma factor [Chloroflexota bacterium]MCI0727407.1 RNA polymerase sigma factor [Chloroflexota bacterium]